MWLLLGLTFDDDLAGVNRLVGTYRGPMNYRTDASPQPLQFDVGLSIEPTQEPGAMNWTWRFDYRPPEFSISKEVCRPSEDGLAWFENGSEELKFKLRNWPDFCRGKCDWFEIERDVTRDLTSQTFRRRYIVTAESLISEKWLRPKGGAWYRSHLMTLRRVAK
jgi:hypothetical protein